MSGSKYFVWGGGRWRELDSASGTVAGWARRARFVFVRRGRLRVAPRRRVLASLQALSLGQPSAADIGPRLSALSAETEPAGLHTRTKTPSQSCDHHHCCMHIHGCNNNNKKSVDRASSPRPARPAPPALNIQLGAAPPMSSLLSEHTRVAHRRRSDNAERAERDGRTVKKPHVAAYAKNESETNERSTIASDAGSSRSTEVCKELTISGSDVSALRSFVARTRSDALARFDADDSYKRALFYAINPLVSLERCSRTERALRQRQRYFAARLGLTPRLAAARHPVADKENVARYCRQPVTTSKHIVDGTANDVQSNTRDRSSGKRDVLRRNNSPRANRNSVGDGGSVRECSDRRRDSRRKHNTVIEDSDATIENSDSDFVCNDITKIKREYLKRTTGNKRNMKQCDSESDNIPKQVKEVFNNKRSALSTRRVSQAIPNSDSDSDAKRGSVVSEVKSNEKRRVSLRNKTNRETVQKLNKPSRDLPRATHAHNRANNQDSDSDSTQADDTVTRSKSEETNTKSTTSHRKAAGPEPPPPISDSDCALNPQQKRARSKILPIRNKHGRWIKSSRALGTARSPARAPEAPAAGPQDRKQHLPAHSISKRVAGSAFKEYSNLEDHAIVAWVSNGARARKVNGNLVWRELQDQYQQLTGCTRTWHSLRNRYLRYILPSLGSLHLPPPQVSRLRAAAALGEIRRKRSNGSDRRNSIFDAPTVTAASARRPAAPAASSPPPRSPRRPSPRRRSPRPSSPLSSSPRSQSPPSRPSRRRLSRPRSPRPSSSPPVSPRPRSPPPRTFTQNLESRRKSQGAPRSRKLFNPKQVM